jgi:Uma2 family endonuclease
MVVPISRYRFSHELYERLIATGMLREQDRVELIRGEIINQIPTGDRHIGTMTRLIHLLPPLIVGRGLLQSQCGIRLLDSQPEPDIAIVEIRADFYSNGKAVPREILLLIEIADSSLEIDRSVKLPLYAENGIVEYWIVNLVENQIEVYRHPQANGTYGVSLIRKLGDDVDLLAFPGVSIPVQSLIG